MGRKQKYHKHLPHSFDEVLKNIAQGNGIQKKAGDNKKHSEKSHRKK